MMKELLYDGIINAIYYLIFSGLLWGSIKLFGQGWVKSQFDKALVRYTSERQLAVSKELEADKNKYSRELAAQRAEYTKELAAQQKEYTAQIETLRNQLAFELARKTKFAEKEFEVLSECWSRLTQACNSRVNINASLVHLGYKGKTAQSDEKTYLDTAVKKAVSEFISKLELFLTFYNENVIYIRKDIQYKLNDLERLLLLGDKAEVSIQECLDETERIKFFMVNWDEYKPDLDSAKKELETLINKRLFLE